MKRNYYYATLAALALCISVQAEKPAVPPPVPPAASDRADAPPPHPQKADRDRRGFGPMAWRAFSRLAEEQRQELLKLQETDVEKFRAKMRELGEVLHKEEQANFAELKKQVEQYRASSDEKEKAALKEKITANVRSHYLERLEDNKRQLEEMKRRAQRLEEELKKREENAEAIIQVHVDELIRGEHPKPLPKRPDRQR